MFEMNSSQKNRVSIPVKWETNGRDEDIIYYPFDPTPDKVSPLSILSCPITCFCNFSQTVGRESGRTWSASIAIAKGSRTKEVQKSHRWITHSWERQRRSKFELKLLQPLRLTFGYDLLTRLHVLYITVPEGEKLTIKTRDVRCCLRL